MNNIYFGTKQISAVVTTRLAYNQFRGWYLPDNEDGSDEGFLVEDMQGKANVSGHEGYVSWLPKEEFERVFQPSTAMSFGHAIEAAKAGHKIGRAGWNGKGMFVAYMPPLYLPPFNTQDTSRKVNDRTAKWIGEDKPLDCQPYFAMYTADEKWVPGWLASQTDMLAEDWQIVG